MTEDKLQLTIPRKSFIFIVSEPSDSYKVKSIAVILRDPTKITFYLEIFA